MAVLGPSGDVVKVYLLPDETCIGAIEANSEPWVKDGPWWQPLRACRPRSWPFEDTAGRAERLYITGEFFRLRARVVRS